MSLTTTRMEFGRSSKMDANNSTSNARGSAAECNSHHPPNSSNAKKSRGKNYEDGDDFMVSTFVQSGIAVFSNKNLPASPPEKLTTFSAISPQKSCSSPSPNFNDKTLEGTNTNDMKSGNIERNHSEQKRKETTVIKDSTEIPDCRRRFAEPSNFAKISSDQDPTGMVNVVKNSRHSNAELHPEATGNGALGGPRCSNGIDVVRKGGDSRVRNECSSKSSPRNSQSSPNEADKFNQKSDDKPHGSLELGDRDRNEVSEASMMDSISSMEISPDDVVAVIGPKHFWKARRAIVNQQRVFAVQVFELHRLIKVQKLIAASPDVLEANLYLSHSPTKVPTKNVPPENIGKSHQPTVKQKGLSQKPNQNTECPEENTIIDPPPCQIPRSEPAPVPSAPDNRPSPWCFQQPLNQWLVPVMSPSEGLVYKPYTRPCPPTAGFMAPFYGSCAPLSFPPVAGDFMNLSYAISPSHQQPPNYLPIPYGLPIMNPIMPSAIKQVRSQLVGSQPNVHDPQHSWSSYNVLNSRSEAISDRVQKFQASKESEVQGSTVSCPCEEAREAMDAPPLPPMDWVSEGTNRPSESCGRDNQTRVIRVVPHNARSATMSAARIFQSIQEERQQYDS